MPRANIVSLVLESDSSNTNSNTHNHRRNKIHLISQLDSSDEIWKKSFGTGSQLDSSLQVSMMKWVKTLAKTGNAKIILKQFNRAWKSK